MISESKIKIAVAEVPGASIKKRLQKNQTHLKKRSVEIQQSAWCVMEKVKVEDVEVKVPHMR